ncbi:MAG: hypothetical protein ACMG6E_08400 [Candidatus Roizmanbacteria bacterium]
MKKNFKSFLDILTKSGTNTRKAPKKELNANPFGVQGLTSRNNANKENYGGQSNNNTATTASTT